MRADAVSLGTLPKDVAILAGAKVHKVNRLDALYGWISVTIVAVAVATQVTAIVEPLAVVAAN